jgi:hypothetical protein
MFVLHFSITPLAGSPIRIVRALNAHTNVEARHIVLDANAYGTRTFETDLIWQHDRDEIQTLLDRADILHFHHFFDLRQNPFEINFLKWERGHRRILRQFHSNPLFISRYTGFSVEEIVASNVPQLVISQYHERYFPWARLVPNIVPISDPIYLPSTTQRDDIQIFYAPTSQESAWSADTPDRRWDTKGYPEVSALLLNFTSQYPDVVARIVQDLPHIECLKHRRDSSINIDDMVTGSYHLSSLEGLAQGVPTFAYLDDRTQSVLREISGANELPWMNFRFEESEAALRVLTEDTVLRHEIASYSRRWMEKFWDDRLMVIHFVNAYQDLLERGQWGKPRFDPHSKLESWFARDMSGLAWQIRAGSRLMK